MTAMVIWFMAYWVVVGALVGMLLGKIMKYCDQYRNEGDNG